MLNTQQTEIIKATIPVLEEHGTQITSVFYKNMFAEHPELLDIFNKTNQIQGRQQTALAMTVLAAAKHIENLSVLLPQVTQIGYKHRALQIQPEHYPIVGKHLLKAIKEVLGEAANDDILSAWAAAYEEIANVFISVEKGMYEQALWKGFAKFKVIDKQMVAPDIAQFVVKPADDGLDLSAIILKAGQYITVKVKPENSENIALRHYSLCSVDTGSGLHFAVKRDNRNGHQGLVSNYLHDEIEEGDEILLSAPAGDFLLNQELVQSDIPLVLISAGVGITPVLSMLESQIEQNPARPIIWAYACQDESHQAFSERVHQLTSQGKNVTVQSFFSIDNRLDKAWLQTLPNPADVYVCGSMTFMENIISILSALEHKYEHLHYEPFGPKMSLQME